MQPKILSLVLLSALTSAATAQLQLTVPNGTGSLEGSSSNAFPWGSTSTTVPGLRVQSVYDSSNFTAQGVTFPVLIQRCQWRANATTSTWVGGTYANASVALSTAPIDYTLVSTNWAGNEGADKVTVYQGPVQYLAGTGNGVGVIGPTVVDVVFQTPFLYDPNAGDLVIDADHLLGANFTANGAGTSRVSLDVQTTGSASSRVYASTNYPTAAGTTQNHGVVVTLDYVPASGLYAGFSASSRSGPAPLTVNFTDATFTSDPAGVTSWAWDFDGDGVVDSTLQNPSYTYTGCGDFNVSLTVNDGTHPPSTLTQTAYIKTDEIAASFTSTLLVPPNIWQFTDTSTPPATAWAWDTDGDGIDDDFSPSPVVFLPQCQATTVRLTATRNCRTGTSTQTLFSAANQLDTIYAANNGGSSGWLVFSDLNVTNPLGITLCGLGHNTGTTAVGTPFTCDVYITDTTYVGKDNDITKWRLAASGSGTAAGGDVASPTGFAAPLHLPFGSYGMAVQLNGASVRYTGTGTTFPPLSVSNADVTITTGAARTTLFAGGSLFSVRQWNGSLYYDSCSTSGAAAYGFMGLGCAGSLPASRQTIGSVPQLGGTLSLTFDNLPLGLTVCLIGASNTFAPGFGPLPVDLSVVGMTGCTARVSPDLSLFGLGLGNTATINLAIPADPALVCVPIYTQALTPDALGNPFGWVLSDAAGGPIGN